MAGENFVGALNALYGRLDQNVNRNMEAMDPANLLKEQYTLEGARRALQQDAETRNALSGVQSMEDVPAALPGVIRSDPRVGIGLANSISGLSNAETEREWKQQQRQAKMIGDAHQMLSSLESEPDPQLRAQNYPVMLRQVASMYPEIVPLIGKTIPLQYDPNWSKTTLQSLVPAAERYKADMAYPKLETVQQGDQVVTYRTFPGGGMSEVGRGEKWSPNQGLAVTLPDGTTISQGGKGKTATGLQPGTQKDVEEGLLKSTGALANTIAIRGRFKPQYQTIGGQLKGAWLGLKDKWDSGALGKEDVDYLNDFTQYRAEAGQQFAEAMKAMSGVAVTPEEAKRQETYLIKTGTGVFDGDSPQVVQSKMDRFVQFNRRAISRLNFIRKNGMSIKNMQNIPLESMDRLIADRIGVIKGKLKASGVPPDQVESQALQQVSEEFGLVN